MQVSGLNFSVLSRSTSRLLQWRPQKRAIQLYTPRFIKYQSTRVKRSDRNNMDAPMAGLNIETKPEQYEELLEDKVWTGYPFRHAFATLCSM